MDSMLTCYSKTEWTRMRNMIIEAKLQKLGVEKGVHGDFGPSDSFNPHIRAASVGTFHVKEVILNEPFSLDLIPSRSCTSNVQTQ